MIHEAQVHLAGYVATEPKFRKVTGDVSSARLRVAYTSRRRDKETGEWADGPTSFVTIQCWRTLADNVSMSVHKGEPVLIMGRLQIRRYEDAEGAPRTAVEVEATSVGHDLARGVAQFSRTRWPMATAASPPGEPGAEDAAEPEDCAEPGNGTEPGNGAGPGNGTEPGNGAGPGNRAGRNGGRRAAGEPSADGGGASGDGVIDERGVAEFARELGSFGATATADTGQEARTDAEASVPA
jgi:single-strand DNA-binding protein